MSELTRYASIPPHSHPRILGGKDWRNNPWFQFKTPEEEMDVLREGFKDKPGQWAEVCVWGDTL